MENISADVLEKAAKIKLLICDVDGVLSDGKVYYSNNGDEIKSFNIKDGLGIKQLINQNIQVAIITGRQSNLVERRAKELGIQFVFQGRSNKQAAYDEILGKLNIEKSQVAHIGDDLPDLPLMQQSGLGISVSDGHFFVQKNADWVTSKAGGQGAVRELADMLLFSQNKLQPSLNKYLYQ
jgi:3-deoxy-D-manno-octulosonate 8-phosphate phosphatase (KDO 8-P phosphatase)